MPAVFSNRCEPPDGILTAQSTQQTIPNKPRQTTKGVQKRGRGQKSGQVPIVRSTLRAIWLLVPAPFSVASRLSTNPKRERSLQSRSDSGGSSLALRVGINAQKQRAGTDR